MTADKIYSLGEAKSEKAYERRARIVAHVAEIIRNCWNDSDYEYKRFGQILTKRFGKAHWQAVQKQALKQQQKEGL